MNSNFSDSSVNLLLSDSNGNFLKRPSTISTTTSRDVNASPSVQGGRNLLSQARPNTTAGSIVDLSNNLAIVRSNGSLQTCFDGITDTKIPNEYNLQVDFKNNITSSTSSNQSISQANRISLKNALLTLKNFDGTNPMSSRKIELAPRRKNFKSSTLSNDGLVVWPSAQVMAILNGDSSKEENKNKTSATTSSIENLTREFIMQAKVVPDAEMTSLESNESTLVASALDETVEVQQNPEFTLGSLKATPPPAAVPKKSKPTTYNNTTKNKSIKAAINASSPNDSATSNMPIKKSNVTSPLLQPLWNEISSSIDGFSGWSGNTGSSPTRDVLLTYHAFVSKPPLVYTHRSLEGRSVFKSITPQLDTALASTSPYINFPNFIVLGDDWNNPVAGKPGNFKGPLRFDAYEKWGHKASISVYRKVKSWWPWISDKNCAILEKRLWKGPNNSNTNSSSSRNNSCTRIPQKKSSVNVASRNPGYAAARLNQRLKRLSLRKLRVHEEEEEDEEVDRGRFRRRPNNNASISFSSNNNPSSTNNSQLSNTNLRGEDKSDDKLETYRQKIANMRKIESLKEAASSFSQGNANGETRELNEDTIVKEYEEELFQKTLFLEAAKAESDNRSSIPERQLLIPSKAKVTPWEDLNFHNAMAYPNQSMSNSILANSIINNNSGTFNTFSPNASSTAMYMTGNNREFPDLAGNSSSQNTFTLSNHLGSLNNTLQHSNSAPLSYSVSLQNYIWPNGNQSRGSSQKNQQASGSLIKASSNLSLPSSNGSTSTGAPMLKKTQITGDILPPLTQNPHNISSSSILTSKRTHLTPAELRRIGGKVYYNTHVRAANSVKYQRSSNTSVSSSDCNITTSSSSKSNNNNMEDSSDCRSHVKNIHFNSSALAPSWITLNGTGLMTFVNASGLLGNEPSVSNSNGRKGSSSNSKKRNATRGK